MSRCRGAFIAESCLMSAPQRDAVTCFAKCGARNSRWLHKYTPALPTLSLVDYCFSCHLVSFLIETATHTD